MSEHAPEPEPEDLAPEPAVELVRVSKGYTRDLRQGQRNGLAAIRDELRVRRDRDRQDLRTGEFWAVRDVSLTVYPGDALGIVGVNGAGKSTLLRLVAGITQPTAGEVRRRASVGTLLDPNAGFNPVLTGRENAEVAYSLIRGEPPAPGMVDEILAYADIPHAADHPVRTYSSGMRLRLGFSVMVFVDPDVLVIDEALAVGDTPFQLQCLDHLHAYCRAGGALVFTSHSMWAFQHVATRGVHVEEGRIVFEGAPDEATDHYLSKIRAESVPGDTDGPDIFQREQVIRRRRDEADGDGDGGEASDGAVAAPPAVRPERLHDGRPVQFAEVEITGPTGGQAYTGQATSIRFDLESSERFEAVSLGFMVWTADLSVCVFADISDQVLGPDGVVDVALDVGRASITVDIDDLPLAAGQYAVRAAVYEATSGDIVGMTGFQDTPWWFDVEDPSPASGPALVGAMRPLRVLEAQIQK